MKLLPTVFLSVRRKEQEKKNKQRRERHRTHSGAIQEVGKRFRGVGMLLLSLIVIGTVGYKYLGKNEPSLFDAFYMTIITISTIGFGEVVKVSTEGRVFTIFIALSGIGLMTYILTNIAALIVEGDFRFEYKLLVKATKASKMENHYIICGYGDVSEHIINEPRKTERPMVIIDQDRDIIKRYLEDHPKSFCILGDATTDDVLLEAGIKNATGLFAATGDDTVNLVIILSAKQLNPDIKIISRCNVMSHVDKMKKVGAQSVILPNFIGGMRMASEMVRPTVTSFLDVMLRDSKHLRVEEVVLGPQWFGKTVDQLHIYNFPDTLILAVKESDGSWVYNPRPSFELQKNHVLVVMTTPEERMQLAEHYGEGVKQP